MIKNTTKHRLSVEELYNNLIENEVEYFCGVPDSLLSSFGFYLEDYVKGSHFIAANEGNAIAMAIGYHLATSKLPLVYMQNSGLGNSINPLVSLADPTVLGIPMLLMIGWRGQPGKKDEPQHLKQGMVTEVFLKDLGISYSILSPDINKASLQITSAVGEAILSKRPFALLVGDDILDSYKSVLKPTSSHPLSREYAIKLIVDQLDGTDIVVATTGKTCRELFEHREKTSHGHSQDLLVVGGMGHASSIAMAIAQQKSQRKVFCLDGDGAALMHMGSLATIGSKDLKNFYHFLINNGAHDSVGGQPTVALSVDMLAVAKASGYSHTMSVDEPRHLKDVLKTVKMLDGPVFVEVRVNTGSRPDLKRPTILPVQNKESFMHFLDKG